MDIFKAQTRLAARAFGDALVRTVPTTTVTLWIICYAFEMGVADMMRIVCKMQPIRPLVELLAGR